MRNEPMAPEKTHSQDPCCLPSWEKGRVWPQQPPPPVRAWLLSPLRWSLGATRLFFFFFIRIFSLFLFSILFVRVSQSLFTTSLQLEPSRPKRWRWTWLFMAALASIGNGRPWKPLSLFFCAISRLKRASLTSSCLLQKPKRPFPNELYSALFPYPH